MVNSSKNELMKKRVAIFVVLLSVLLNSAGQMFFKAARTAHQDLSILSMFLYVDTWIGFVLYGLSAVCWLWVLSRTQLSYAYPLLSLSFPIVVALSAAYFGEVISPLRWIGVCVIVVGVSFLART